MTNSGRRESLNGLDRRVCWEPASDLHEQWLLRAVKLLLTCYQSLSYSTHFIKDFLISAFMPFSRQSLHAWQKMSHAHAVGLLIPFLFSFSVVYILAATFYVDMFQKARDKASHKRLFFFSFHLMWEREREMRNWLSNKKKQAEIRFQNS